MTTYNFPKNGPVIGYDALSWLQNNCSPANSGFVFRLIGGIKFSPSPPPLVLDRLQALLPFCKLERNSGHGYMVHAVVQSSLIVQGRSGILKGGRGILNIVVSARNEAQGAEIAKG